jgi:hypothetical protein
VTTGLRRHPWHFVTVVFSKVPLPSVTGIAFARNNTTLCQEMDAVVQTLRTNGTFARLPAESEHFVAPSTKDLSRRCSDDRVAIRWGEYLLTFRTT